MASDCRLSGMATIVLGIMFTDRNPYVINQEHINEIAELATAKLIMIHNGQAQITLNGILYVEEEQRRQEAEADHFFP